MQTQRYEIQTIRQTITSDAKRSLSYNDLKKKRLLISEKSKSKLKQENKQIFITRTEKKKTHEIYKRSVMSNQNTPLDENKVQYQMKQLKEQLSDAFNQMKQKSKTKTKNKIISKPYYTDRMILAKKQIIEDKSRIDNQKKNSFFGSISIAGNDKNLIKEIIAKKKSQRRLLKLQQIRNQVKRQKSKSKSKQKSRNSIFEQDNISNSKVSQPLIKKILSKNIGLKVNKFKTVSEKPEFESQRMVKNQYDSQKYSHRIKFNDFNTEKLSVGKKSQNQSSFTKLKFHRKLKKSCSQIVIKNKSISVNNFITVNQNKSAIIQLKQQKSSIHNPNNIENECKTIPIYKKLQKSANQEQNKDFQNLASKDQKNTLDIDCMNISQISLKRQCVSLMEPDSYLNIVQEIEQQQIENHVNEVRRLSIENRENLESVSNVLDLMILPTQQLKIKMKNNSKMIKKKNQLQKFKKIFPKNFFKQT